MNYKGCPGGILFYGEIIPIKSSAGMRTRAFGKISLMRPRSAREFAGELFAPGRHKNCLLLTFFLAAEEVLRYNVVEYHNKVYANEFSYNIL